MTTIAAPQTGRPPAAAPALIDIDEERWESHVESAATWLGQVLTAQVAFCELLEATVPKIKEPVLRLMLAEMLDRARHHENLARHDLWEKLGREPSTAGRGLAGKVMGAAHRVLADIEGLAGGAAGSWRDVRELLVANVDAMGAFAVVEQIGLVLGNRALRDLGFDITKDKSTDQLILQELMLEMASVSLFYKEDV